MSGNIDTALKFDDLLLVKYLKDKNSPFLQTITEVYNQVQDNLDSRIPAIFPKYTLHNTGHSFRIIEYMFKLVKNPAELSDLEITLLICSALLHDIGMAVHADDVELIKTDNFSFCEIKFSSMKKLMNGDETLALQEYIRRIHASLSGRYVREKLKSILIVPKFPNLDFSNELALICESHTQDFDWIKSNLSVNEIRGDYYFNSQFIACVLRLGDILDIDANRTPFRLYESISPQGLSDEEWKQHYVIQNSDKVRLNELTKQKEMFFYGICENPHIHRKILNYIDWVKNELVNSIALLNQMSLQYCLMFDASPKVSIQTKGYTFSDYKMVLQFRAISSLLMGEKIYGSRTMGLRELIQNSIDACKLRQEKDKIKHEYGEDEYKPKIKIILDSSGKKVSIQDNGVGMSMQVIKNHFLNIGISYYKSDDFLLRDFSYKPIGNYGIGFLSCFMLSDQVTVNTRNYNEKDKYTIKLEQGNEWISLTQEENLNFYGTEVVLDYDQFMKAFNDKNGDVKGFLSKHFITDGVELFLINKSAKTTEEIKNKLMYSSTLDKGVYEINLGDYLKDIEGYALIKHKPGFLRSAEDVDFKGELFIYDETDGLILVDDPSLVSLDKYILSDRLQWFDIPLVEYDMEDDVERGLLYTDNDVDEVVEKFSNNLTWISVLVPVDYFDELEGMEIESGDEMLDNFSFQDLVDLGHSESCKTKLYSKNLALFEGKKDELYLQHAPPVREEWEYLFMNKKLNIEVYLRNVLVQNAWLVFQNAAALFEILEIKINVKSRKFIPDISRNNLDNELKRILSYVVGKAIHLGAKNSLNLKTEEKEVMLMFIEKYYSEKTEFER